MVLAKAAEPNFNEEYPLNKDVFVMDSFLGLLPRNVLKFNPDNKAKSCFLTKKIPLTTAFLSVLNFTFKLVSLIYELL